MTARHRAAGLLVALVCLGVVAGPARSQGRAAAEKLKIMHLLTEVIETKDFTNPMTLKDGIQMLHDIYVKKGKELPILVDVNAFREENTEAGNPYDEQMMLPALPKQMALSTALRLIVSQVKTNNARYVIRRGYIEITTADHTTTEFLLRERVRARFTKAALPDVLAELTALTGAPIVLDVRAKEKLQEITIDLDNLALEDALTVLTEQAGLKFVVLRTGIFVTTPAEARVIEEREERREKERMKKARPEAAA